MIKKILLTLILFSSDILAQWIWLNPTPQGSNLRDAAFSKSGNLVIVGEDGNLLHSSDKGIAFDKSFQLTTNALLCVISTEENYFYTASSKGEIFRSIDNGISWQLLSKINDAVMDMTSADMNALIAVCYSGKIFKSYDGGITWVEKHNPGYSSLFSISYANNSAVYAVGNLGLIIKSEDNGDTWNIHASPASSNIRKIQFLDENVGYLMADIATVYKTTDGGNTWFDYFVRNDLHLISMEFFSSSVGIIMSYDGAFITVNGINWQTFLFNTRGYLGGLCIDQDSDCIVVTSDGQIYFSENCETWTPRFNDFFPKDSYNIRYFDFPQKNDGILISYLGSVYSTSDGGFNWNMSSNFEAWLWGGDFWDNSLGIIVGPGAQIFRTTDFGKNWTDYSLPNRKYKHFWAVEFVNKDTVVAVGFEGTRNDPSTICRSTDSGISWDSVAINTEGSLNDVSFCNSKNGIAVGDNGLILKTTDSGITWNVSHASYQSLFSKIIFINPQIAYLLDWYGSLFKSEDGGIGWTPVYSRYSGLNTMDFYNEMFGILAGNQGKLVKTTDGVKSWNDIELYLDIDIKFIKIIDENTYIIADDYGKILKTTSGGVVSIMNTTIAEIPNDYFLCQSFPNPFNPVTVIGYQLPVVSMTILKIYDILGREVATLVNEEQKPGTYKIEFDGSKLASGVYFYRLQTGNFVQTKKMILMK